MDGSQPRKHRKERSRNSVGTEREEFTEVSPSGKPLAPKKLAGGYGNQVGCILRDTVSIYEDNLRDPSKQHLLIILMRKLHRRYRFPQDYDNEDLKGNVVNNYAITKMSTALASWRARVKKMLDDKRSFEEIQRKERVDEEDLRIFKGRLGLAASQTRSAWGKWMRTKNVGNHHLGSGGYFAAEPKWKKEDDDRKARHEENPFDKYKDEQTRNFIRARYVQDKKTKQLKMDEKVQRFEKVLQKYQQSPSAGSESSQGSTKPLWDTTFNMAMNEVKGVTVSKKPSGGRVVGHGKAKWGEYYHEDAVTRKERKKLTEAHVSAEIAKVPQLVQDEVAKVITSIFPHMVQSIGNWIDGGRIGPCPVPSLTGSNSINAAPAPVVLVNPATNTAAPELNAPVGENSPAGTVPTSSPSVSCTPAVGGASTIAELDAITVTKRRRLNRLLHPIAFAWHL